MVNEHCIAAHGERFSQNHNTCGGGIDGATDRSTKVGAAVKAELGVVVVVAARAKMTGDARRGG